VDSGEVALQVPSILTDNTLPLLKSRTRDTQSDRQSHGGRRKGRVRSHDHRRSFNHLRDAAASREPPATPPFEHAGAKPKRLLKLTEAAEYLTVSKATLYKLTMTRKIPFYKIGSRTMYSKQQLMSWVQALEHLPEEPSPRSTRKN
jgi:excisionase family DNA binding protein